MMQIRARHIHCQSGPYNSRQWYCNMHATRMPLVAVPMQARAQPANHREFPLMVTGTRLNRLPAMNAIASCGAIRHSFDEVHQTW